MTDREIEVGDELYFAGFERRPSGMVTVEKVGRLWIQISNGYRIDKETLTADGAGYISPGRCFRTKEEYDARKALDDLWSKFRRKVERQYRTPEGICDEDIHAAAKAFKIDLSEQAI